VRLLRLISEMLDFHAAELRTGRSLVEAVALDEHYTELLAVTGSDQAARDVLDIAVEVAKYGVRPEQVAPMVKLWHTPPSRTEMTLLQIRRALEDTR
jgi:hypothetical protein